MLCITIFNSKTIELTVYTSCYLAPRLTLCNNFSPCDLGLSFNRTLLEQVKFSFLPCLLGLFFKSTYLCFVFLRSKTWVPLEADEPYVKPLHQKKMEP